MRRSLLAAVVQFSTIALALTIVARPAAAADQFVSLAHLAPELGYTYTWIASEDAVALTRPGLYVLVRTGNPLYDVNDSVESTVQAPQSRNNDVYVGSALAARLRALAAKYAPPGERADPPSEPVAAAVGTVHGALALSVAPTKVSDAVVVSGSGPANLPLTISLSADIVRDMPRVLLSRTNVRTDAEGNFSVTIATAPLHLQRTLVLVSATSLPGVSEAHTSFVLGKPSPNIAHPLDDFPRDFLPQL
jgi:hypothetical protein